MPWREKKLAAWMRNFWRKRSATSASIPRNVTRPSVREVPSLHNEVRRKNERMATEFKLPELGENIESGDLVRLMIKPGASIAQGQPVMELETDKAVVEVPSSVTGTIGEIRVKEGDKLRVGQVIFTVENGAGTASSSKKDKAPVKTNAAAVATAPEAPAKSAPAPQAAPQSVPQVDRRAKPAAAGPSEFKMPELGENIDAGDLVRLMIAPGDTVAEGQPVMELETDT